MTKPHAAWIIQRARNAGWTLTAIAAELGVSRRAVYNWLDGDVWTYIRERGLPYCSLYDEGFKRLGCIVCCYNRNVRNDVARWPKMAAAAQRALARRWATGKPSAEQLAIFPKWQDYWEWWLRRVEKGERYPDALCEGLFA